MISSTRADLFGMTPQPMSAPAPQPFQWGQGGARMTPDDIAMRRKMAMQESAAGMDFSPVQSWTQGASRVAQALMGAIDNKQLDKAAASNADYSSQIAQQLIAGQGGSGAAAAGIVDPYASEGVHELAKMQFQVANRPPPAAPQPTEFERMVIAAGYQPGTDEYTKLMRQAVTNKANPMQAVPGFDEQGQQVLRFIRPSGMSAEGGGQLSPAVPSAPVGKLTPIGGGAPSQGARTFP